MFVDFEKKCFNIKFKASDSINNTPKREGIWYQGCDCGQGQDYAYWRNSIKTGELSKTVIFVANLPFSIDDGASSTIIT